MSGIGEKNKLLAKIKHFRRCLKWSKQRIARGYADCDIWSMYSYLQRIIPDMLQTFKDTRMGSPSYLGKNYADEDGIIVNDTCHEEWDKILDHMIFLGERLKRIHAHIRIRMMKSIQMQWMSFVIDMGFLVQSSRQKKN